MTSLDFRTRTDDDIVPIDTAEFFGGELPELIAANAGWAAPGARELEVAPFTFLTPSGTWTLTLVDESFVCTTDDDGAAAVRLTDEDVADIVNDLKTPMTFLTGGRLDMLRGDLGDFLDWWVVLRSLIDARPVHTRGAIEFHDRNGDPLDLHRSFGPEDDDADIAHFLGEAGFLHLRNWFDADDMAEISADMDSALATYRRDDGRSWWARTADGRDRCVRMQYFDEHSPRTIALLESERHERIGALTSDGHVARTTGNRIEALVKPIGVVEGISDVPWHKDCSLGMHSYRCCGLTTGISVTGADERSGQLRVVAGSHRALVQPAFVRSSSDLPIIDLPTEAGAVTVHCSCTLHMAQPPIERERKVMYTGFGLPERGTPSQDRAKALGDIGNVREGAYKTVSQAPGYTGAR
jgi:Phytanoyl-CoA dioxygenase (PhyH)